MVGRSRVYYDIAERQRAYRARRKAAGNPVKRGGSSDPERERERERQRNRTRNRKAPTKFADAYFIGVDGEGEDYGPVETFTSPDGVVYETRAHKYTLLAARSEDGWASKELYRAGQALETEECLEFLCELAEEHRDAIFVAFASGYDVNHMLMFGLPRDDLWNLAKKGVLFWRGSRHSYDIEFRPRKSLTIRRYPLAGPGFTLVAKSKWRKDKPEIAMTLWDTWGFFQSSFVDTIEKWLGQDVHGLEEIKEMKELRSEFHSQDHKRIVEYNALECELLAKLMDKVRESIQKLDLSIKRWDGAGAIAAAMNAKHDVRKSKCETPEPVFEAARRAYSGGHIETCQIGRHVGPIWHYDVNSAYPSEFIKLPDLRKGEWVYGRGELPLDGFTVVHVKWAFSDPEAPFYPLFYREETGSILYPQRGDGWYWYPEYEAAVAYCDGPGNSELHGPSKLEAIEWWHFKPSTQERPFEWVKDYYKKRQEYVQAEKKGKLTETTRWQAGAEKVIKLGLNSLYGKTAQQVGARKDENGELQLPAYFQMEWAGYVTSGCRSKLMLAAIQKPHAIIAFATDAIFSTEELDLDAPVEKTLGLWEFTPHTEMVIAMSGVYWSDGKGFSRGFDKASMRDADPIIEAWRKRRTSLPVPQERLIGIGSAVTGDTFWAMRGRFVRSMRELCLTGKSLKRLPIHPKDKPHLGLCRTWPNENYEWQHLSSAPYKVAWIDDDGVREVDDDLKQENAEETDVTDA